MVPAAERNPDAFVSPTISHACAAIVPGEPRSHPRRSALRNWPENPPARQSAGLVSLLPPSPQAPDCAATSDVLLKFSASHDSIRKAFIGRALVELVGPATRRCPTRCLGAWPPVPASEKGPRSSPHILQRVLFYKNPLEAFSKADKKNGHFSTMTPKAS